MSKIERNSLGEIMLPIYLNALSETRVALSKNPQQFLDAFAHIAGREHLIIRCVHQYLRALSEEQVKELVPVLKAMSMENRTPASATP